MPAENNGHSLCRLQSRGPLWCDLRFGTLRPAAPRHLHGERAVTQPQAHQRRSGPAHDMAQRMVPGIRRTQDPRLHHGRIGPEERRERRMPRVLPCQQVPLRRLQVRLGVPAKRKRRRLVDRRPAMGASVPVSPGPLAAIASSASLRDPPLRPSSPVPTPAIRGAIARSATSPGSVLTCRPDRRPGSF